MLEKNINIQSVVKILKDYSDRDLIHEISNNKNITYFEFLRKSEEFFYFLTEKKKIKTRR